jgi:hypothetical protein
MPESNMVLLGHDPTYGAEGTDVLVQVYPDGSGIEVSLRPGRDQTWLTWRPPVPLEDADVLHRVEGADATVPALLRYLESVERGLDA